MRLAPIEVDATDFVCLCIIELHGAGLYRNTSALSVLERERGDMKREYITNNKIAIVVVVTFVFVLSAGNAFAWGRSIHTSTSGVDVPTMSYRSYTNMYEARRIAYIAAQESYVLRYAKWENKVESMKKKAQAQKAKKQEIELRKKQRELRVEKGRISKVQVARRSTSSSFLPEVAAESSATQNNQGIRSAQGATGVEQTVRPRRPTLFQRLKYAFTGSYE